jgi:hypothetical protein
MQVVYTPSVLSLAKEQVETKQHITRARPTTTCISALPAAEGTSGGVQLSSDFVIEEENSGAALGLYREVWS